METINPDHPFANVSARYASIEQQDLAELTARYSHLVVQGVQLDMNRPGPSFFEELAGGFDRGRRGEALLAIRYRDGRIWAHTKSVYPAGVYRLPSGGIGERETALEAARREVREEAGLYAEPADCVGILRYQLRRGERVIPFITYVFLFGGGDHMPAPQDVDEHISDFRLLSPADLPDMACALRQVQPARWQDWGHFRALAHDFLFAHLPA
jgi:8-oxo-dGTP diphosphatase